MVLRKNLVGIIGGGSTGYHPFDKRTWSGVSRRLFNELKERGVLHRALGVEVGPIRRTMLKLSTIHPDRSIWRRHYYMSRGYRHSLTTALSRLLTSADLEHDLLVIGALYDVPSIVKGATRTFSYHDGSLAGFLKSPFAPKGLSSKRIEFGLRFERKVHQGTDRIFTFSEYLRQSFISDYGMPPDRVVAIGAGMNLDTFPDADPDKAYDTKAILFIGAEFRRKGGDVLLEAFRRVRESHPTATLHIVGPTALQVPEHLLGGVTLHGYLDKYDPAGKLELDNLFRLCSVFVLPSLYEPFGIAPLEAMVHGIPAVVSRGWALQETVTAGVTGEHVEVGSVDDLTERLRASLAAPERLQRMGHDARNAVLERFTWSKVVDRMTQSIAERQSRD